MLIVKKKVLLLFLLFFIVGCSNKIVSEQYSKIYKIPENELKITLGELPILRGAFNMIDPAMASFFTYAFEFRVNNASLAYEKWDNGTFFEYYVIDGDSDSLELSLSMDNSSEQDNAIKLFIFNGNQLADVRIKNKEKWTNILTLDAKAQSNTMIDIEMKWNDNSSEEVSIFALNENDPREYYFAARSLLARYAVLNQEYNFSDEIQDYYSSEFKELEKSFQFSFRNKEDQELQIEENLHVNEEVSHIRVEGLNLPMQISAIWVDTLGNEQVLIDNQFFESDSTIKLQLPNNISPPDNDYRQFIIFKNRLGKQIIDDVYLANKNSKYIISNTEYVMEIPPVE